MDIKIDKTWWIRSANGSANDVIELWERNGYERILGWFIVSSGKFTFHPINTSRIPKKILTTFKIYALGYKLKV